VSWSDKKEIVILILLFSFHFIFLSPSLQDGGKKRKMRWEIHGVRWKRQIKDIMKVLYKY